MKLGMNLLLWTGQVTSEHFPLLAKLKAAGFDGVEIPVFGVRPPTTSQFAPNSTSSG